MPIHVFKDPTDYRKGGWFNDGYGRPLAEWTWHPETRVIEVRRGSVGRTKDLSGFDAAWLTDDELRQRLPDAAFEIADSMAPFDRPKSTRRSFGA